METRPADSRFRVERIAAPLRHSITESIRNAIAAGYFKAGDRLPERELCEMTGVSRTLVREALRQLESEGTIQVLPHRGPIVARLSPEDAEGIYQVRAELEGLASELFTVKASQTQRQQLERAFDELKQSISNPDPLARLNAKNGFYACLVEGAGNRALGTSLRMLNARVALLRATSMQAPGRIEASIGELAELMEALAEKHAGKARKAAVRHVRNAAKAAIALLDEEQAS